MAKYFTCKRHMRLRSLLVTCFILFIFCTALFAFLVMTGTYDKSLRKTLTENNASQLKSSMSTFEEKLKIHDAVCLALYSDKDIYNIMKDSFAKKNSDNYQFAVNHKILNQKASSLISQSYYLSDSLLFAVFSKHLNVQVGDSVMEANLYENEFLESCRAQNGRLTLFPERQYHFVQGSVTPRCFGIGRIIRSWGEEIGYALMLIESQKFFTYIDNAYSPANELFAIYMPDGQLLHSNGNETVNTQDVFSQLSTKPVSQLYTPVHLNMQSENQPHLISALYSETFDLYFVKVSTIAEFESQVQRNLYISLLAVLLFCLLATFLSVAISRSIIRPIDRLKAVMAGVTQGELRLRAAPAKNPDMNEMSEHFNLMIGRILELMQENEQKQQEILSAELSMLSYQINPHFIYNTLDAIKWLAIINNQQQIRKVIDAFNQFLQNSLDYKTTYATIQAEMEIAESYAALMKVCYGNFEMKWDVENPSLLKRRILRFTLQPIIENSIIHGLRGIRHLGMIQISIRQDNDKILIHVTDNGAGISRQDLGAAVPQLSPAEKKQRSSKIGLANIDQRMKLHFGSAYGIHIDFDVPSGSKVDIILPLEPPEEPPLRAKQ